RRAPWREDQDLGSGPLCLGSRCFDGNVRGLWQDFAVFKTVAHDPVGVSRRYVVARLVAQQRLNRDAHLGRQGSGFSMGQRKSATHRLLSIWFPPYRLIRLALHPILTAVDELLAGSIQCHSSVAGD